MWKHLAIHKLLPEPAFLIAVFDGADTLDHFLSLKLLNSMVYPLCLFTRTVNIINNLRCLVLNIKSIIFMYLLSLC